MKNISFSKEFQEKILANVDWRNLRKLLRRRKHEIMKFLTKISIDLLLDDVPNKYKTIILDNEDRLRKNLGIKFFKDLRHKKLKNQLSDFLVQILPKINKEIAEKYSLSIIQQASKYQ